MKTIALIEDNESLRAVLTTYFKVSPVFEILFAVADVTDAIKQRPLNPHIILLDIDLPSGCGIDAIPVLNESFAGSKIIMLSNLKDAELTRRAIQSGASGYLLKSSSMAYIHESLMRIEEGGLSFSPETISHLIKPFDIEQRASLTKRELEIVALISRGKLYKQVADQLNISCFTVNQHLKNIYKKLNVNSKSELTAWYLSYRR